ncbi:TIR domain-containing protein [Brasilonema sp. CT11]|nr:TIR domain-containing protein [Brasilonema sp. CT11]
MARSIFFSFHYQRDIFRVNRVRNHYLTKGGYHLAGYWDHSLWEEVKKEGDLAIKRMINTGLKNTSVTVVLIGAQTAERRWVKYEIEKSYERGNGMLGIYIHNMKCVTGSSDVQGRNPFDNFFTEVNNQNIYLSQIYPTYNWVYDDGYNNFSTWVERAAIAVGK